MSQFASYPDMPTHSSIPPTPASATGPGPMPQYSPYSAAFMHAGAPVAYSHAAPMSQYASPYVFGPIHPSAHAAGQAGVPQYATPQMSMGPVTQMPEHVSAAYPRPMPDPTGQIPPCGARPRITATYWEDESCTCYQVEANGICVARRSDTNMINGTKLLNVAGMTRGRRDGILKSEKVRHVVKVGPMHLKGVWIPFDRALDFANKENITEILFPLFRQDLRSIVKTNDPSMPDENGSPRRQVADLRAGAGMPLPHPSHIAAHTQTVVAPPGGLIGPASAPLTPHGQLSNRPSLGRAHPLPSPPDSTSSVSVAHPSIATAVSYEWHTPVGSISATGAGSAPIPFDSQLASARSIPTTPAATPPGSALSHSMHTFQQQQTHYDTSRTRPYLSTGMPPIDPSYHQAPARYTISAGTDLSKKPVLGSPIRQLDNNPAGPLDGTVKHEILEVPQHDAALSVPAGVVATVGLAVPIDTAHSVHEATYSTGNPTHYDGTTYTYRQPGSATSSSFHATDHSASLTPTAGSPVPGHTGRERADSRSAMLSQAGPYHWNAQAYATPPSNSSSLASAGMGQSVQTTLYGGANVRDISHPTASADPYSTPVEQIQPYQQTNLKRTRDTEDDGADGADGSKRRKTDRLEAVADVVVKAEPVGYPTARPSRVMATMPRRR